MDDIREIHRARGEDLVRHIQHLSAQTGSVAEVLYHLLAPDARVHIPNGDVVSEVAARHQIQQNADAFPDMEIEFVDAWYPDDRVVIFGMATGKALRRFPVVRIGFRYRVRCAFIARATPDLTISEFWGYLNPGFGFHFPAQGVHLPPPPADGATEEHARALYNRWFTSAQGGQDFVSSVIETISPRGVVHLGNGDSGDWRSFGRIFDRIGESLHDVHLEIEEITFDGPRIVAPFRMHGTHHGRLGIYAPTGRVLHSTGLLLARADEAGDAIELWLYVAPGYALAWPPGQLPPD